MGDATVTRPAAKDASTSQDDVSIIEAVVIAVVLPYHQALLRSKDDRHYAITRHTAGIVLEELYESQMLELTVIRAGASRVVRARPVTAVDAANACGSGVPDNLNPPGTSDSR